MAKHVLGILPWVETVTCSKEEKDRGRCHEAIDDISTATRSSPLNTRNDRTGVKGGGVASMPPSYDMTQYLLKNGLIKEGKPATRIPRDLRRARQELFQLLEASDAPSKTALGAATKKLLHRLKKIRNKTKGDMHQRIDTAMRMVRHLLHVDPADREKRLAYFAYIYGVEGVVDRSNAKEVDVLPKRAEEAKQRLVDVFQRLGSLDFKNVRKDLPKLALSVVQLLDDTVQAMILEKDLKAFDGMLHAHGIGGALVAFPNHPLLWSYLRPQLPSEDMIEIAQLQNLVGEVLNVLDPCGPNRDDNCEMRVRGKIPPDWRSKGFSKFSAATSMMSPRHRSSCVRGAAARAICVDRPWVCFPPAVSPCLQRRRQMVSTLACITGTAINVRCEFVCRFRSEFDFDVRQGLSSSPRSEKCYPRRLVQSRL